MNTINIILTAINLLGLFFLYRGAIAVMRRHEELEDYHKELKEVADDMVRLMIEIKMLQEVDGSEDGCFSPQAVDKSKRIRRTLFAIFLN